ncbi:MAG: hypothetical protein ACLFUH_11185, partial [Bacteroidales bacterium]
MTTENGIFYLEDLELNKFKEMKDQSWGLEVFGKDEGDKMLLAGTNDGFPSIKNINVYPYKERVVFGTEEGIYKYDNQNDTFKIDSAFGAYFLERDKEVFAFQEGVKDKVYATGLENKSSPVAWGILDESGQYKWQNEPFLRLPEMMVLSLYEQNDSVLWVGGSKGLFKYNFGDYDIGTDLHTMIREVVVNQDSTLFFGNLPLKLRENANYLLQNSEPI